MPGGAAWKDAVSLHDLEALARAAMDPEAFDFVAGGLLLSLAVPAWSVPRFFSDDALLGLLAIIVITPALHRAANLVGYRMGKKHEPW